VCIPFAWFWLTPYDLKDFGQSLTSVSLFSSNLLFWIKSGYFDIASELKPLLHTWSLAVEEQFYILFPIFLLVTWRLGIKWVLLLLLLVFVASLGIAHWSSSFATEPKIISGSFFLLPTRAWELLVGVFAAFYLKHFSYLKSHPHNQMLSLLGLSMVIYSVFSFDTGTPFPSLYTLIPTLGTCLLILSATPKTVANRLLSFRPLVGLGLISYSTYLWHQPILAFSRHIFLGEMTAIWLVSLCIASIVMGFFSWYFIEKPFRNRKVISRNVIFIFSILGIILFSMIGFVTHLNKGFEERLSIEEQRIAGFLDMDMTSYQRYGVCFLKPSQSYDSFSSECINGKKVIWGDSNAAALSFGLRFHESFSQLTASACPPLVGVIFNDRPLCKEINTKILEIITKENFEHIYLHSNWIRYSSEQIYNITSTIDELLAINPNLKITVIGSVPQWKPSLPTIIMRNMNTDQNELSNRSIKNYQINEVSLRDNEIKDLIAVYSDNENISFISLLTKLCDDEKCLALVERCDKDEPITWDSDHLGTGGSMLVARLVLKRGNEEPSLECLD